MRLTSVLQFYIRYRRVPGLLRYGKERVVPPISIEAKRKAVKLMLIEKDNMDILNKPYLSQEEEAAYYSEVPREIFRDDKQKWWDNFEEEIDNLNAHFKTEDLLWRLNLNKKWE